MPTEQDIYRPCNRRSQPLTQNRYVFGNQVEDFIDKVEADYSLAKSSLTYLCSGIFDINQSDKTLSKNMTTGKYRLHSYVTSQWIELTRRCIEHSKDLSAYPDLLELLTRLALELRNYNSKNQVIVKDPIFEGVTGELLEISQIVCGALQFRQDERQTGWNYSNGVFMPVLLLNTSMLTNPILQAPHGSMRTLQLCRLYQYGFMGSWNS